MSSDTSVVPPARPASIDFMECLRMVFDDPAWLNKLLIGSLVSLAGVLILPLPLLLGYQLRVLRRTLLGEAHPLPEWDDWGGLFIDGLKVLAVFLPHQIGLYVVVGLPIFAVVSAAGVLGEDRGGPLVALLVLPLALVAVVLALVFVVYIQAALVRLAATDQIAAAYDPGANVAFVRRNPFNLLLAFAVLVATGFVAQFGVLLCCVGLIPATLWSQLSFHYALGRAAALDPQRGR